MAFTSCGTYCHLAICEETFISHNTQHKTDYLKNCEKTVAATVDFCQTKKSRPEAVMKKKSCHCFFTKCTQPCHQKSLFFVKNVSLVKLLIFTAINQSKKLINLWEISGIIVRAKRYSL